MIKASWNGKVVAESNECVEVEGNKYFSPKTVNMKYFKPTNEIYNCPWKGICDYYDVVVDGKVSRQGAWVYKNPKPAAKEIKGRFAFWHGVKVTEE